MADQQPSSTGKPASPAQALRLLKVTLLAYRNPNMTEDEFHTHWSRIHSAKASAHLAKFGILSYRQYHTPSSLRAQLTTALPSLNLSDAQIADYDGFVELLMPRLECYENALRDPYYRDVIAVDDGTFADMARSKVTVGWVEGYVEEGEVVQVEHREGYRDA